MNQELRQSILESITLDRNEPEGKKTEDELLLGALKDFENIMDQESMIYGVVIPTNSISQYAKYDTYLLNLPLTQVELYTILPGQMNHFGLIIGVITPHEKLMESPFTEEEVEVIRH